MVPPMAQCDHHLGSNKSAVRAKVCDVSLVETREILDENQRAELERHVNGKIVLRLLIHWQRRHYNLSRWNIDKMRPVSQGQNMRMTRGLFINRLFARSCG